jgi:transposase-like protein
MTKPKRYKRYSVEFKREAIRRGSEEGTTDAAVCAELGISTRQFRRWRDELQLLGNDDDEKTQYSTNRSRYPQGHPATLFSLSNLV